MEHKHVTVSPETHALLIAQKSKEGGRPMSAIADEALREYFAQYSRKSAGLGLPAQLGEAIIKVLEAFNVDAEAATRLVLKSNSEYDSNLWDAIACWMEGPK